MHHHIVDHRLLEVHQPPVQADGTIGAGTAPACAGAAERELAPLHTQRRGKVIQPLGEDALGLTHQPGLHRVTNLHGRGAVGQRHMQREAGCIGIGVEHGTGYAAT